MTDTTTEAHFPAVGIYQDSETRSLRRKQHQVEEIPTSSRMEKTEDSQQQRGYRSQQEENMPSDSLGGFPFHHEQIQSERNGSLDQDQIHHHHQQENQYRQFQQHQCYQRKADIFHLMGSPGEVVPDFLKVQTQCERAQSYAQNTFHLPHHLHHQEDEIHHQLSHTKHFSLERKDNVFNKESTAILGNNRSNEFQEKGRCASEFLEIISSVWTTEMDQSLTTTNSTIRPDQHFLEKSPKSPQKSPLSLSLVLPLLKQQVSFLFVLALVSSSLVTGTSAQMEFVERPRNTSQLEGKQVVMRCRIRNLQGGGVQWSRNGLLMGEDRNIPYFPRLSMVGSDDDGNGVATYNLKIANVQVGDEGWYKCQVPSSIEYPDGFPSESIYLSVIVPPKNVTIISSDERKVEVYLNSPTNITCRARKSKPAAYITFIVKRQRVEKDAVNYVVNNGDYSDTIGILTYNASLADMSAIVECQATIPNYSQYMKDGPLRATKVLDVLYVPNITMTSNISATDLKEHDFVRFQCSGDGHPNIVQWRWERNDDIIPGATTNTYVIPAISYDYNNNKISCIATNKVGTSRIDKTLEVKFGAKIVEITEVVGADLGKPAELRCEADGNPPPVVTWRRKSQGGVVAGSQRQTATLSVASVLRINSVNSQNFGWYVCTATVHNFDPSASAEAMLLKNDRPNLRSEKDQMAQEGKAARLECLAHSIPKPSKVTWTDPTGAKINFAMSGRFTEERIDMLYGVKSILHISSANSGDFGYYNCTITNDYGTASERIQLVEKHVLPITFIIIGVIAGVVVMFVAGLACVLYMRCRSEKHQGSVLGSYTDTDSSSDKTVKKRDKLDSPSTLMGQLRQDYNKEMYRFSADYDDMPYKRHLNGDAGGLAGMARGENTSLLSWAKNHRPKSKLVSASASTRPLIDPRASSEQPQKANNNGYGYIEPYEAYSDHQIYDGEYVHRGDDLVPERIGYDPLYGSGNYSMSSFRANNYDTSTPPPTMTRLTPLHMSNSKLATDV